MAAVVLSRGYKWYARDEVQNAFFLAAIPNRKKLTG